MMQLRLVRVTEYNGATLGVLCLNDSPDFVTLEDAWRANERMVGRYKVKLHRSPKFGIVYRIENVPERSEILFHAGNTAEDTHGCVLVGMQYGKLDGNPAVLASRSAFNQFMDKMAGVIEADLLIIDAYGGGRVH